MAQRAENSTQIHLPARPHGVQMTSDVIQDPTQGLSMPALVVVSLPETTHMLPAAPLSGQSLNKTHSTNSLGEKLLSEHVIGHIIDVWVECLAKSCASVSL